MGAPLLAGGIRLAAAEAEQPLTMPFQAATFVSDADSAAARGGFAEFSARLLYWTDTPRGAVLLAGQMLKPALLPFIEEWRGLAGTRTRWPGPGVGERVRVGYRSLEGARLAHRNFGVEVLLIPPPAVDAIAGDTVDVPVIVENIRNIPVRVDIAGAGKATEAGSP
ncbi:MAG: hypothetical protein EXS33_00050 [Pedosphaera sp.]|nr:hypothetical protein [Pedosphaera sp.]